MFPCAAGLPLGGTTPMRSTFTLLALLAASCHPSAGDRRWWPPRIDGGDVEDPPALDGGGAIADASPTVADGSRGLDAPGFQGTFEIVARHSGKCLSPLSMSGRTASPLVLRACAGLDGQAFRLEPQRGAYRMVSLATEECVEVTMSGLDDGVAVRHWRCNGTAAQAFRIAPVAGGFARIANENSGKCLAVISPDQADGVPIQQFTCDGSPMQNWTLAKVTCR